MQGLLSTIIPDKSDQYLMLVGGLIGVLVHFAFGDVVEDVVYLFALVAVDYLLGNWYAWRTQKWSSSSGFRGITKKAVIFLIIALCHWADVASGQDFISFRTIVICAYALNELGSILENLELLGYGKYIPPVIRKAMKVVEEQSIGRLSEETFNGNTTNS